MVISSFISSILVLALGIWAYMRLESTMNIVAEKQLLIEPSKFSYKMWKDMPVTMYQSFTFFNLTNWNQVKSIGQKPRFVEVGPYVYRTIWTKTDINFLDEEKLINFSERKQWIFQPSLSRGSEEDLIWTINTPLMTALALIQNAPVITRNIVSVILDGLGEGAFIKRNIRSLLFEGYSDLIVSVGPLFDRRFANFNGKFAYLYNKNDSVDGTWTVSTGSEDVNNLNKIIKFHSNIVNMTSHQMPIGLNEVKPECAQAWTLDQATNGQLFAPFNRNLEHQKLEQQLQQLQLLNKRSVAHNNSGSQIQPPVSQPAIAKRFFGRGAHSDHHNNNNNHLQHQDLVPNPFINQRVFEQSGLQQVAQSVSGGNAQDPQLKQQLRDLSKFIFYPDLCRPIHLLPSEHPVLAANGIQASRYFIDPRVFMNSTQVPGNKCFEMNPRPPLANALAATINSVTGANVAMPNLVVGASSPFAMFSQPAGTGSHHHGLLPLHALTHAGNNANGNHHEGGLFERTNNPASSFINTALNTLGSVQQNQADQLASSSSNGAPVSRLGRVRQLFNNIVSQRMSVGSPGSLLPSLAAGPAGLLIGNHFGAGHRANQRSSVPEGPFASLRSPLDPTPTAASMIAPSSARSHLEGNSPATSGNVAPTVTLAGQLPPPGGSDRWITQFRFKWPRGVFSIGQCQLGAPIYASLPHFLDADDYYLEQVDGLKPNRSLHEFYIDIESTLHSIPVGAKARLQLNVATPELRFRNIPNAMIPVLWQEVTFTIDKPVASLLYWSFTMSGTLYKLLSVLLVAAGGGGLVVSVWRSSNLKRGREKVAACSTDDSIGAPPSPSEEEHYPRSVGALGSRVAAEAAAAAAQMEGPRLLPWQARFARQSNQTQTTIAQCQLAHHLRAREIIQRGALNAAFSGSCGEIPETDESGPQKHNCGLPEAPIIIKSLSPASSLSGGRSPKQPSSRASSHCELVSGGLGGVNATSSTPNCAGCLLACLRHSNNNNNSNHIHNCGPNAIACDNSIVRQLDQCACQHSDQPKQQPQPQHQQERKLSADEATISSRGSVQDNCSLIYNRQHSRAASSSSSFK